MRIGIIGAGNVGKALASSMERAGHDVIISATSPDSAASAAHKVGATPAGSNVEAARGADVVILAVPYVGAGEVVASEIRDAVAGKTVIDVTNPIRPDYSGLATTVKSGAEEFQDRLPGANVVKAFNTIFASNQANPSPMVDAYIAADDADARARVAELARSIGFTPVEVGPLSAARALEGMAYINIGLNAQNGWSWTSSWKLER